MGMAFEITSEDVINVLAQQGFDVDYTTAQTLLDDHLNDAAIEKAALRADDLDEQTDAAYVEILNQLTAGGHLEALRADQRGQHLEGSLPTAISAPKPRM